MRPRSNPLLDRFLRYVQVDTQSQEDSPDFPSTAKQLDLSRILVKELKALGIKTAKLDKHGYVMASLAGNRPKVPVVGFIAHVDTSPEVSGAGVKPQILTYKGGDIVLPKDPSAVIRVSENPQLASEMGRTVVTTDGTTLLGADDKAGVAIVMALAEALMKDPKMPRGDVKIAFTPDEEVGSGSKFFNLKSFGADMAYTIDGDKAGEINKETFSADTLLVTVTGRDIHPGSAKDIMVNAARAACEIVARLPQDMAPETTEGRQPYIHPYALEAGVGKAVVKILLRDFETEGLRALRKRVEAIVAEVRPLHPKAAIAVEALESYRNMGPILEKNPLVLEVLEEAVKRAGLEPRWVPIRGGTDGSRLTAMGLPTPNIWMGGSNAHSKTEWASLYSMEKSLETALHLVRLLAEKSGAA